MRLENPSAFLPGMGDEIAVHVSTRLPRPGAPEGSAETVRVPRAFVGEREPDSGLAGAGVSSEGRSVVFPAASWTSPLPPSTGAWIDPDPGPLRRWGRLTVKDVRFLGGLVHLHCSEREVPANGAR